MSNASDTDTMNSVTRPEQDERPGSPELLPGHTAASMASDIVHEKRDEATGTREHSRAEND